MRCMGPGVAPNGGCDVLPPSLRAGHSIHAADDSFEETPTDDPTEFVFVDAERAEVFGHHELVWADGSMDEAALRGGGHCSTLAEGCDSYPVVRVLVADFVVTPSGTMVPEGVLSATSVTMVPFGG